LLITAGESRLPRRSCDAREPRCDHVRVPANLTLLPYKIAG